MQIDVVEEVTEPLAEALGHLVPQLSTSAPAVSAPQLQAIVDQEAVTVLAASLEARIVGTLTLVTFTIPTGIRAWIEDVVVDQAARGQGVAAALVEHAVERAAGLGARTVDLTSRPSRVAANALYAKVGFQQRETNVYRLEVASERWSE